MGTIHEEEPACRPGGKPVFRAAAIGPASRPAACRILVVDDDAPVRRTLRLILEHSRRFEVRAECACADHALRLLEGWVPHVVLMDIRMPGMDGLECTRQIRQRFPQVAVVIVTGCGEAELVMRALLAGACGYLLKPFQPAEVVAAVDHALSGRFVLEAPAFDRLRQGMCPAAADDRSTVPGGELPKHLSVREQQILELLARHCTKQEMARKLRLQPCSVDTYVRRLYAKLKAPCRAGALAAARAAGLLPRDVSQG